MQTTTKPYEFLARWDADGTLSGAHVQWRTILTNDDGTPAGEVVGDAKPVAVGSAEGFPLADILQQLQADALTGREEALAACKEALAAKSAAEAEAETSVAAAQAERDAAVRAAVAEAANSVATANAERDAALQAAAAAQEQLSAAVAQLGALHASLSA